MSRHKEIREYAEWLGIESDEDEDLLWIARRGLMTPLPKPWKPCQSSDGEIFYFNPLTGENTWDHPCDAELRDLYASERALKKARLEAKVETKETTIENKENSESSAKDAMISPGSSSLSSLPDVVAQKSPAPPPAPPKTPQATGESNVALPQTPLGLLGPLPPLAPPKHPVAPSTKDVVTELDDPFDMPLDLGASQATPRRSPATEFSVGDPPSPIMTAEILSPIETTEESPSPSRERGEVAPKSRSGNSPQPAPQPAVESSDEDRGTGCCDNNATKETEECERARLSRELESLRSEVASQASEFAAEKAKEKAVSNSALSALSQEFASEVAESRRLRIEKAKQDEELAFLRNDSAARLAAQAQAHADLEAQLRVARTELEHARKQSDSNTLPSPTTAKSDQSQLPHGRRQVPPEISTEGHDVPSELSPPTPSLASILVAELRPSAHAANVEEKQSLGSLADCSKATLSHPSLWSQLKEDSNLAGLQAAAQTKAKDKSYVANSSLDFSSLSAALVEQSFDLPCPRRKVESPRDWPDAIREDSLPKQAQPSLDTKVLEEVRQLRDELGELRLELKRKACAEEVLKVDSPMKSVTPKDAEPMLKHEDVKEAEVELASSETCGLEATLPSSSRCPTLTLQGCRNESCGPLAETTENTLPSLREASRPRETLQVESHLSSGQTASVQGRWKEHCQSLPGTATLPSARETNRRLQHRELELHPSSSRGSTLNLHGRWDEHIEHPQDANLLPSFRESRHRLENAETELQRLTLELEHWRKDADDNERILQETRTSLHKEQASHVVAKATIRENQREAHQLRSRLKSQESEAELASNALQRMRTELEDEEAEKQRLQLCLQTRDIELRTRRKENHRPEFLANWRRELRREHAVLDEDRRLWRCEANRLKHQGHESHTAEREILAEVRAALDTRAAVLNNSIGEYRAASCPSSPRRRSSSRGVTRRPSNGSHKRANSASALTTTPHGSNEDVDEMHEIGGSHEDKLRRRWHHVLKPSSHRAGVGGA